RSSGPTLFPYTTLFRSGRTRDRGCDALHESSASRARCQWDLAAPGRDQQPCPVRKGQRVQDPQVLVVQRGAGVAAEAQAGGADRSEEHTSELQSRENLV